MPSRTIFLDESGDLGWKLDSPYLQGGSSRFLTISAICVPSEKSHLPKRIIRKLYEKCGWSSDVEKKWSKISKKQRLCFVELARKACEKNKDFEIRAIVVNKERVMEHIRTDPNKLYNYMIKLMCLDYMAKYDEIHLIPDPRSIKVESGNSLHDYLQMELWFNKNVKTILKTTPIDSVACKGLQFADLICGVVQSAFEFGKVEPINALANHIKLHKLYFRQE